MPSRIEKVSTGAVVLAALAVAGANVYQVFASGGGRGGVVEFSGDPALLPQDQWEEILRAGVLVGDSEAPITLVEFADLECPFCRRFHESLREAKAEFGDDLALVYVHFPIDSHRFARPSARAAECAAEVGAFGPVVDVLFDKQDSLGLKSWGSFAADAGVLDTTAFAACAGGDATFPRIEAGVRLGERVGVTATPTIVVNRWRLATPPYESLTDVIRDILSGEGRFKIDDDEAP